MLTKPRRYTLTLDNGDGDHWTPCADEWLRFVNEAWEAAPAILDFSAVPAFAEEDVVWDALLAAAECFRSGVAPNPQHLFLMTHEYTLNHPVKYLPKADDQNFDGYFARLSAELPGEEFAGNLHGLQQFWPPLWEHLRRFVGGLFEADQRMPAGGVSTTLIFGRYHKSPFRVHKDAFSAINITVKGQKRFLVWPFETFAGLAPSPETLHEGYALDNLGDPSLLDGATELELRTGEAAYWPAAFWHVGESSATQPHVSLLVSFGVNVPRGSFVTSLIGRALPQVAGAARWDHFVPLLTGGVAEQAVPEPLEAELAHFEQLVNRSHSGQSDMARQMAASWLSFQTSQGFDLTPALKIGSAVISDSDQLVPERLLAARWCILEDTVMLSAHGRVVELALTATVRVVLEWLQLQQTATVNELIDRCEPSRIQSDRATVSGEVKAVLQGLAELGAIRVV